MVDKLKAQIGLHDQYHAFASSTTS